MHHRPEQQRRETANITARVRRNVQPVAYFAMNRWRENFVYRFDLTPLVFIGSGLIALCIAWVTVGSTAANAASAKPALALRYE